MTRRDEDGEVWHACATAALDLHGHPLGDEGYDLLLLPVFPAVPVYLWGEGAAVWRALLDGDTRPDWSDEAAVQVAHQLAEMGLASRERRDDPAGLVLAAPWLRSPQHEMVYALLSRVARDLAIDILFIKGPALHDQGLRAREHSGDVDCWVRPGEEARLAEAMRDWGWTPLYSAFLGTGVPHSLTLRAGEWGCAIDVHSRFPGMAVPADVAFDVVRERAQTRRCAGVLVAIPARPDHAVIAALHELRPNHGRDPGAGQVQTARQALAAAGRDVIRSTHDLGAGFVLGSLLRDLFGESAEAAADSRPPVDWGWRSASGPRRHVKAFRTVPWRQRARVLRRLVWPTRTMMLTVEDVPEASAAALLRARVRRLWRAVRAVTRRE